MGEFDKLWFDFKNGTRKPQTFNATKILWERATNDDWKEVGATATWTTTINENGEWTFRQKKTGVGDRLAIWDGSGNTYDNLLLQSEIIMKESSSGASAGLLFRLSSNAATATGYLVELNPNGSKIELFKKTGNNAYTSLATATVTLKSDLRYLLSVRANATRIIVSIDGIVYIDIAESTYTSAGRIGLRANSETEFKNVLVSEIVSSIPLLQISFPLLPSETHDIFIPYANNLVVNGGFESSTVGVKVADFDNWTLLNSPTVEVVSDITRSGSRAVKLIDDSASLIEALQSDSIARKKDLIYLLECDIYIHTGTDTASVALVPNVGNVISVDSRAVTGQWQRVHKLIKRSDFSDDAAGTFKIELRPATSAGNTATTYFDNVTIRECIPILSVSNSSIVNSGEVP